MAVAGPMINVKKMYNESSDLQQHFLKGSVVVGRLLGRGAFGKVEELFISGTRLAGKQFHDLLLSADGSYNVQKFETECRLMAEVKHPNIVQFMGICMLEGSAHPVLVMEYLDMSLDSLLETKQGRIPLSLKFKILLDIICGLLYLHTHHPAIIHRDLTARNILLNKASLHAKIADLGNALMTDSKQLANTLSKMPGTPLYMPPEANGRNPKYDTSLDMFSFGHLSLYVAIDVFPENLLPATSVDPDTEKVIGYSEIERRHVYFDTLYGMKPFCKDHPLCKMIESCLSNLPIKRPKAEEAHEILEFEYNAQEDPYTCFEDASKLDLLEMVQSSNETPRPSSSSKSGSADTEDFQSSSVYFHQAKTRVQELKEGKPGVMELYQKRSILGFESSNMEWKQYVFVIKDQHLKYYRSNKPNKIIGEINLETVKSVTPFVNTDMHKYYFRICFAIDKLVTEESLLLSTFTADERIDWMEAIFPGSVAKYNLHNLPIENEGKFEFKEKFTDEQKTKVQSSTPKVKETCNVEIIEPNISSHSRHPTSSRTSDTKSLGSIDSIQRNYYENLDGDCTYVEIPITPVPYVEPISLKLPPVQHRVRSSPVISSRRQIKPQLVASAKPFSFDVNSLNHDNYKDSELQPPDCSNTTPISHPIRNRHKAFSVKVTSDSVCSTIPHSRPTMHVVGRKLPTSYLQLIPSSLPTSLSSKPPPLPSPRKSSPLLSPCRIPSSGTSLYTDSPSPLPRPSSPANCFSPLKLNSGSQDTEASTFNSQNDYEDLDTDMDVAFKYNAPVPVPPIPKPRTFRRKRPESEVESLQSDHQSESSDKFLITDDDEDTYIQRPDWAKADTATNSLPLEHSLHTLQHEALFILQSDIRKLNSIGRGQYGEVYKAEYTRKAKPKIIVAVKAIKAYDSEKARNDFLKEMDIMSQFVHPNVVKLYGLVQQDSPLIVLEYLENGDLKNFLKKNRRPVNALVKYMLDVSMGMHYIAEKGLVHRDIAARNVIVGSSNTSNKVEICKISDFGLLREIPKDDSIYVSKHSGPVPIRWMAPESLKRQEFSSASDVWSYGILLWEMRYPSKTPYPEVHDSFQVAVQINSGLRLNIPKEFPNIVQRIMMSCWQEEPSKRPSFLLISNLLSKEID